ncbi:MAG TPA: hypothetical protein VIV11_00925 [Kofleriaceae bacterium]
MKRLLQVLPPICLALGSSACMSSDNGDIVGPFTGSVHRFVVDRFSLPTTSTDARAIGDDLDGDGRVDNQLGTALASLAGNDNLTLHADDMIKSGAIASVIEIQADNLDFDPTVGVRYFGREGDPIIEVGGAIKDGVFHSNLTRTTRIAGAATLRLPVFADASPSVIAFEAMEIELDPDDSGYQARIRGGVGGKEVLEESARGLIEMMEANPDGHPYAISLFDADHDGFATLAEITTNSLMMSLLHPDVELLVEGKRVERLSFGFAVHAIPCATGNCALGTPANTCFDRIRDGDESDIDCGGTCLPCAGGETCSAATDCQSASCNGTCAAPSCSDGVESGYETDVDCGGRYCSACAIGQRCRGDGDCATGRCGSGVCF